MVCVCGVLESVGLTNRKDVGERERERGVEKQRGGGRKTKRRR